MVSLDDVQASESLETQKKTLRQAFRKNLKDLTVSTELVKDLQARLLWLLESLFSNSGQIASYRAFGTEAIPPSLSNYKTAYPRVSGQELDFYQAKSSSDWDLNEFGIEEPKANNNLSVEIDACDAVIVPGLAFDHNGGRLGRGKGFYDRALKSYQGTKIGYCFHSQVLGSPLPRDHFDIAVDYIVTERAVIQPVA